MYEKVLYCNITTTIIIIQYTRFIYFLINKIEADFFVTRLDDLQLCYFL